MEETQSLNKESVMFLSFTREVNKVLCTLVAEYVRHSSSFAHKIRSFRLSFFLTSNVVYRLNEIG
jgi:hypothetical protein